MDHGQFDGLARTLGATNRRESSRLLFAGVLTGLLTRIDSPHVAARKRKKKKKKKCKAAKGKRRCGKACIALDACCQDAECGAQAACVNGSCACLLGSRPCRGACIPEVDCCEDAECGAQSACVDGNCFCGPDLKFCAGRCIPLGECCTNADCPTGTGMTCQRGGCDCPPGQQLSAGVCGVLPSCTSPDGGCNLQSQCCSGRCMPDPYPFGICLCSQAGLSCKADADCCAGLACVGFVCRS